MKTIIVGMGIQGEKRFNIAGSDVVGTVDPYKKSDFKNIYDVPLNLYDSAILCIQDDLKIEFIEYFLKNKKNVMVEKPLLSNSSKYLIRIKNLAKKNNKTIYTAYNHRFEPHFINLQKILKSKKLGKIYSVRLFYGNGTARLVRNSKWRDQGSGVLPDLGSHILDTLNFWFDKNFDDIKILSALKYENKTFDNVVMVKKSNPSIVAEISLVSWRNHFYADIYGEKGSAHISSLCKWGPSSLIVRNRILPSGRPIEESTTYVKNDPTWDLEYKYFKALCKNAKSNIDNDIWINKMLIGMKKIEF